MKNQFVTTYTYWLSKAIKTQTSKLEKDYAKAMKDYEKAVKEAKKEFNKVVKEFKKNYSKLEKERNLQKAMLNIKKKYGRNAVLKGMNLEEGGKAIERNEQIGGHRR